jgi:hypothetical protein
MEVSVMNLLRMFVIWLAIMTLVSAQKDNCGADPDSLTPITVSGTALVDSIGKTVQYFIDVDGDDLADYKLNFGPKWYQPDSSDALRPLAGEIISIEGGLSTCEAVIIVYVLNDEYWRDPYEPYWHGLKPHRYQYGHTHRNHRGYAYGWINNDSISVVTLEGVTIIDTTFKHYQYFLDIDTDSIPDYFLNFGPPWYNPEALTRPEDGDTISVIGALIEKAKFSVLFVFELDGEVWLDSTGLSTQFGAGWIHKNMNQSRFISDPFDQSSGMEIGSNWHPGNKGQNKLPDSLYCQMLRLFPENIPYGEGEQIAAGYEIGIFTRNQENVMVHNDSVGDHLQLATKVKYQLCFDGSPEPARVMAKSALADINVKVYNSDSKSWDVVEDAVVDAATRTVSFESETVYSLLIITGTAGSVTSNEENSHLPDKFSLKQNYPNPFNPVTTIEFVIVEESNVLLSVYNILGQKVFEILNDRLTAGAYAVDFDAAHLSSGIYFYELKAGNLSQVKRMTLLK